MTEAQNPSPSFDSFSRTVDQFFVDGLQYEARLGRKRTYVDERVTGKEIGRNKKKKKTNAALKRKVGARIEMQFDPRYEAPAEVGSPRAHLT